VPAPARRLRRAPAPAVDIPLPEPAESPAPPAAPVEAVAPAAASEQAVAARPTERRGARRARCCRAEEGDARPTPEIAAEADLLRRALLASRSAHDDRGALALLDAYDARFPRGALGWEAAATRAQVLLHLGDRGGALAILDRLPLSDIGRPAGLIVTRGELRSLAGRCQEALLDFELALRTASRLEAAERARAVYGRASCRARTGDAAGAERDRQQYLDEFPEGPAAEHLRGRP
jgi:tetratricopeptide (TPR) repeat protein